jgi:hypothetical protein
METVLLPARACLRIATIAIFMRRQLFVNGIRKVTVQKDSEVAVRKHYCLQRRDEISRSYSAGSLSWDLRVSVGLWGVVWHAARRSDSISWYTHNSETRRRIPGNYRRTRHRLSRRPLRSTGFGRVNHATSVRPGTARQDGGGGRQTRLGFVSWNEIVGYLLRVYERLFVSATN